MSLPVFTVFTICRIRKWSGFRSKFFQCDAKMIQDVAFRCCQVTRAYLHWIQWSNGFTEAAWNQWAEAWNIQQYPEIIGSVVSHVSHVSMKTQITRTEHIKKDTIHCNPLMKVSSWMMEVLNIFQTQNSPGKKGMSMDVSFCTLTL